MHYAACGPVEVFELGLSLTEEAIARAKEETRGAKRWPVLCAILDEHLNGTVGSGDWRRGEAEYAGITAISIAPIMSMINYRLRVRDPGSTAPKPKETGYTVLRWNAGMDAGAVVLVQLGDNRLVFIEQYRPALGRRILELPGGLPQGGEKRKATAMREVAEESGIVPGEGFCLERDLIFLGTCFPERSVLRQQTELYFMRRASIAPSRQRLTGAETDIKVHLLSPEEVESKAGRGEIADCFSLAALYHAQRLRLISQ